MLSSAIDSSDKFRLALENFDPVTYLKFNPDLNVKDISKSKLLEHFKRLGFLEGRLFCSSISKYPEFRTLNVPIFCYHFQNVNGNSYNENISLKTDLKT
jgi:hypothetical protein